MEDQKKLSIREFMKRQKQQMKNLKSNDNKNEQLNESIESGSAEQFLQLLKALPKQNLLSYLFSEDVIKDTPLDKILKREDFKVFWVGINQTLKNNFQCVEEVMKKWEGHESENEFVHKEWKNKLSYLNKTIVKQILANQSQETRNDYIFCLTEEPEKNLFSLMYANFLERDIVASSLPSNSQNSSQDTLLSLLINFYIPLCERLKPVDPHSILDSMVIYKNLIVKEKVWNSEDFLDQMEKKLTNSDILELKELNFTFMHQIFLKEDVKLIERIHDVLENSGDADNQKLAREMYCTFNMSGSTPIDEAIRNWSIKSIKQLLLFIEDKENATFSTNSINMLLYNKKLSQEDKDFLIQEILEGKKSKLGYCDMVKIQQHVELPKGNNIYIPTAENSVSTVFDKSVLLTKKDHSNSYPLLTYLDLYMEKSSLKTIQKLSIKTYDRKHTKVKVVTLLKSLLDNPIPKGSQAAKEIENIQYYHDSMVRLFCRLNSSEVSQYLMNLIFFNSPELKVRRERNKEERLVLGRHYLATYIENRDELQENSENKEILERVFGSKDSERFIGQNYDLYRCLLQSVNQTQKFKTERQSFLITAIRSKLREYFDKFSQEKLLDHNLKLALDMAPYFFNQKDINKQNYRLQKDWPLYSAEEICQKFKNVDLKSHLIDEVELTKEELDNLTEQNKYLHQLSYRILQWTEGFEFPQAFPMSGSFDKYGKVRLTRNIENSDLKTIKTFYRRKPNLERFKIYVSKLVSCGDESDIEISLKSQQLQEKVKLLLSNGYNFYFCHSEVIALNSQSFEKTQELTFSNKDLESICRRMIRRKCTFVPSVIHCGKDEIDQIDYLINNKDFKQLSKVYSYYKQRCYSKNNINPSVLYPEIPAEPICMQMAFKLHNILKMLKKQQYQDEICQSVQIKHLTASLQKNMTYAIMTNLNSKYTEVPQQPLKDEYIEIWNEFHPKIKEANEFTDADIKMTLQYVASSYNDQDKSYVDKLSKEQWEKVMAVQKYFEQIRLQIISPIHLVQADLSRFFLNCSIEELFVLNYDVKAHKFGMEVFFIFRMAASTDPYAVFRERIEKIPIHKIRTHTDLKQYKVVKPLAEQFKRFSLEQFRESLEHIIKYISCNDLARKIDDEEKIIALLEYQLAHQEERTQKLSDYSLVGLNFEKFPKLIFFIFIAVQKLRYELRITERTLNHKEQQQTTVLQTDSLNLLIRCSLSSFKTFVELNKQYLSKECKLFSDQHKQSKINLISQVLVEGQCWQKLNILFDRSEGFQDLYTKAILVDISETFQGAGKSSNQQLLQELQHKLLDQIKKDQIPPTDQIFVGAYICNPEKAFEVLKVTELHISTIIKCLKSDPKHAKRFLEIKLSDNIENVTLKYLKTNLPLTAYYYQSFKDQEWMLDLLRVERQILKKAGHLNLLDKTMESLILLEKMEDNFDIFYTEEEKTLKCKKIFSSNTVESLERYPKEWIDNYLKTHSLSNLEHLKEQVVRQLIDRKHLTKADTLKIISTCNLQLVKYFVDAVGLKISSREIEAIEHSSEKHKKGVQFWNFLTEISNDNFIIEFVKAFQLFESQEEKQKFQGIIFSNIASNRKITLLAFVIQFFEEKANRKLEFVFGQKGKIDNYVITLPAQEAVETNFYEYYYLVKTCKNECPVFYVSSRFLIQAENFDSSLNQYEFLPEMKRRLEILSILSSTLRNGGQRTFKVNILIKNLFSLELRKQDLAVQQNKAKNPSPSKADRFEKQNKWNTSFEHFIRFLVEPNEQLFNSGLSGPFEKLLAIIINQSQNKIPSESLQNIYPTEVKIIQSVEKYIDKSISTSKAVQEILTNDAELKAVLLKHNFDMFISQYENSLCGEISNEDLSIYIKGVTKNLITMEREEKHNKTLQEFLLNCFQKDLNHFSDLRYSNYLKRQIFMIELLSLTEAESKSIYILKELTQTQDLSSEQGLFEIALKCNQREAKNDFTPNFDLMFWNSIIKELETEHSEGNLKSHENSDSITPQCVKYLSGKIEKIYNGSSISNLEQLIDDLVTRTKTVHSRQIYLNVAVLMNLISVYYSLIELHGNLLKEVTAFSDKMSLKMVLSEKEFELKMDTEKQIVTCCIPFEWMSVSYDIPLISVSVENAIELSRKQILLQKVASDPSVRSLDEKYTADRMRLFKGFKFKFDPQSLKKIESHGVLQKCVVESALTNNSSYLIGNILDSIEEKYDNDKTITYYSLSDVYGPIKIDEDNPNLQRLTDCLSFYELLQLPSKDVRIKFVTQEELQNSNKDQYNDMVEYLKYFENEVQEKHGSLTYAFKSEISVYDKDSSLFANTDNFSTANIAKCLSLVNSYSSEVRRTFESEVDVRLNIKSIVQLYRYLLENSQNAPKSLIDYIGNLMNSKKHNELIEEILMMILEDAKNIMKVVRGIIITYEYRKDKPEGRKAFKIDENTHVTKIEYQIEEQIFTLKIILHRQCDVDELSELKQSKLVSRQEFLDSIFSSTEFLTDYFLQKQKINSECINVSKVLSKKLNTTFNTHVNYKNLYRYVDFLRTQFTIKQIDSYLTSLRKYLVDYTEKVILRYLTSNEICDKNQIHLLKTFAKLHSEGKVGMEEGLNQQIEEDCLKYSLKKSNDHGLKHLPGYSTLIAGNPDDNLKATFFIQVYKSCFSNIVTEGMSVIIGSKSPKKPPTFIKLAKKEDVNKINLVEISYLLIVSNYIPSTDELNHDKIISIFVSDLNQNIYKVDETVTKKLLTLKEGEEQKSITDLVPIEASNIVISFDSADLKDCAKQVDSSDQKVFVLPLRKDGKYKLQPSQSKPFSAVDTLRKDFALKSNIEEFIKFLNINLIGDCDLVIEPVLNSGETASQIGLSDVIKLAIWDIEASIGMIFNDPSRHNELQVLCSVENGMNIKENVYKTLRRQSFAHHYNCIRIRIVNTAEPKIHIENKEIIIEVSYRNKGIFVKQQQITCKVVENIIAKELENLKAADVIRDSPNLEVCSQNELIKLLDIINTADLTVKEMKEAIEIYHLISGKERFDKRVFISLNKLKASGFEQKDSALVLNFNFEKTIVEFFTSADIVTLILNKFEYLPESQMKTRHNEANSNLEVTSYLSGEVKLIRSQQKQLECQDVKMDIKSPSLAVYEISNPSSQSFQKYWIVDVANNILAYNYISKVEHDERYLSAKQSKHFINCDFYILARSDQYIDMNSCPITIGLKKPSDNSLFKYDSILRDQFNKNAKITLLSRETMKIKFNFSNSYSFSANLGSYKNINCLETDIFGVTISSNAEVDYQKTKFVRLEYRQKNIIPKEFKANDDEKSQFDEDFKQPPEKSSQHNQSEQKEDTESKQNDTEAMVYVVNPESRKYITRAGQKRTDVIHLCDGDGNPIEYKGEFDIRFQQINNLCTIKPEVTRNGLDVLLTWTPTIRGHYRVYLNGICLNPEYEVGVSADLADPISCKVEKPKRTKICYAEESECTLFLRDSYSNIYTELEESIIGDSLIVEIISKEESATKSTKVKMDPIDKYGYKKIRFSIDNPTADVPLVADLELLLNKEKIAEFTINVQGQSLGQRKKNLMKYINEKDKRYHKEIIISRQKFLEDLFKTAEKSLLVNFSVKFSGEQGIDAGGLKRQFYDMIGLQMKSEANPFFKAVDSKKSSYFFNSLILKNKKKEEYMSMFGKYLANSIFNNYLLGINFSPTLIKLMYKDPVEFEDLLQILPDDEAKRYKYLLEAPQEDFEDLEIYFVTTVDRKKGIQVELKEGGSNIQVTKQSVNQYLNLLTKVLLIDKYEALVKSFREGFETVLQLDVVRRWIRPEEFWSLTQGTKEITPEIVLNYTVFQGAKDEKIISWFRRFIEESNTQVLEGYLKFASGSSAIDFDLSSKVTVTFQRAGDNPKKLPISHTCWKEIIVPKYKSYEIMHKLLNAAFIFCSEGFGFG